MPEKNGQATKIISLAVGLVLTFTGYLVATDLNSRGRDTTIIKEHRDDMTNIRQLIHNNQIDMMNGQNAQTILITKIASKMNID